MKGRSRSRSELPEVLVMEILLKLPVKSLTRFNCVCKSWCSHFQTSHFISKHYDNNLKNNHLNLLCIPGVDFADNDTPYSSQLSTEQDDFLSVKHNIFFQLNWCYPPECLGPCHGLLCLYTRGENGQTALWNPSTREFKTLPPSLFQPTSPNNNGIECVGFGFDSNTGDYKVIQFVNLADPVFAIPDEMGRLPELEMKVELYSLKTDSWKEIPCPNARPSGSNSCYNYVNGVCYWGAGSLILSFDMSDDKFSTLPFPEIGGSLEVEPYWFELLEFNGSLGVIVYPREGTEKSFHLWVMKGACIWTKQLCIESISGVEIPLGFWKNGDLFFETEDGELVLFEPYTGELKRFGINAFPDSICLTVYAESLVPINGTPEHEEHIIRRPPSN